MEQGITVVGNSQDQRLSVSIDFPPNAFDTEPVVVANALQTNTGWYDGKDLTDTFAVTITAVSTTGFKANIYRVDNISRDGNGWDQQLRLAWIATDGPRLHPRSDD